MVHRPTCKDSFDKPSARADSTEHIHNDLLSHKKLLPAAAAEQELKTHQVSIPRLVVQSSSTMKSVSDQRTRLDQKQDAEQQRTPLPLAIKEVEGKGLQPLGSKDEGAWIEWEENTPETENERRDEEGGFGKRIGRVDKIGSRLGGFL
jgi:hypothetical protein